MPRKPRQQSWQKLDGLGPHTESPLVHVSQETWQLIHGGAKRKVGPDTQSITFLSFFSRRVHDWDVWCFWIGAHGPKASEMGFVWKWWHTSVYFWFLHAYGSLSLSWTPYSTCLPRLHVTTFKHKLYNDIWMKEREEIGYILILNKFCYSSLIELGSKSMVITFI